MAFPTQRIHLLAMAVVLLSSALAGVAWAFLKVSAQQDKEITRLNYSLKGEFSHQAYGSSASDKPQPNPVYFTRTVEAIDASYSYRLSADKEVVGAEEEIEIKAIVGSFGLWEKEVALVPATRRSGDFTVAFRLDPNSLTQLARDIATELGAGAPSPEITLKAIVHTVAQTEKGQVVEEFVQTARVKVGSATLEFVRPFSQSRRGYFQGLSYEQKGAFSFDVRTRTGMLYSSLSMEGVSERSYLPPPATVKPLPNPVFLTRAIDSIEVEYNYSFLAENPPSRVDEQVEIRAVVGSPGLWEKEVVLVPARRVSGDVAVIFPLDASSLLQLAKDIAAELGAGAPAPEVTLKAIVHTVAQTEKGQLREDFVQNVKIKAGSGTVELVRPFSQRAKGESQGTKYEQRGSFGYTIHTRSGTLYDALSTDEIVNRSYLPPSPEKPLTNPVYFTRIIDSVDASFSYRLRSEKPLAGVVEQVEIRAVLTGPGSWAKDVVLLPPIRQEGDFTIAFPLDIEALLALARDISKELGGEAPTPEITLRAIVRTMGQSEKGPVQEEFVQTVKLRLGNTVLEIVRPLSKLQTGDTPGLKYEQRGNFGYAVHLKDNKLFGKTTLRPEPEPNSPAPWEKDSSSSRSAQRQILRTEPEPVPAPWWQGANLPLRVLTPEPDTRPRPVALKTAPAYTVDGLERVDLTFAYEVVTDRPVTSEADEVTVTAVLSVPGSTDQSITLVPRSVKKGKFTVTLPLDVGLLYAAIDAAEKRAAPSPPAPFYSLLIRAEVNSTAQSSYGPIKDTLRHDIAVKLDKKGLQWPEARPAIKSGAIKGIVQTSSRRGRIARAGSLAALGIVIAVLLYAAWGYRRQGQVSQVETEARQVKTKHKDIVVDVESLPAAGNGEQVIRLASLDHLIKTADALLKPVLHEARPGKHTYCVADGPIRYLHVSEAEAAKGSPEGKPR